MTDTLSPPADAPTAAPTGVQTVHLFVFDGYADWEPAYAVAGINNPDFQRDPARWRVKTVSEGGRAVVSMGGIKVQPDLALADLQAADSAMLILPGGSGWEDDDSHDAAIAKAGAWLAVDRPVAAICGATAGLARAGLLDARAHTSNAAGYLQGTGYEGKSLYREEPAVNERGLITAGGMSPLEFAREIFALLGIYDEPVLQAWYALYKTGQSKHYAEMALAAGAV